MHIQYSVRFDALSLARSCCPAEATYVHDGGTQPCCLESDPTKFHRYCRGLQDLSACKAECDENTNCKGYTSTSKFCDYALSSGDCISGFLLFCGPSLEDTCGSGSDNTGDLADSASASCGESTRFTGCHVKVTGVEDGDEEDTNKDTGDKSGGA